MTEGKRTVNTFSFVILLIGLRNQIANAVITADRRVRIRAKLEQIGAFEQARLFFQIMKSNES